MLALIVAETSRGVLTELGIGAVIGIGLKSLLDFILEPRRLRLHEESTRRTAIRETQAKLIGEVYTRLKKM